MRSCHLRSSTTATVSTTVMFPHKFYFRFSPIFRPRVLGRSVKFRRLFDRISPVPVVTASINSVIASGNVIAAAAAAASGSGSVHGAVTSAITHVAVTAVAIASGACLSTKVDFLWPKVEEQPGSLVLDGVDVTGYLIFEDTKVQKAIEFAKKAHHGQLRKTGDPYLTHCIHTGKILAALVPPTGNRVLSNKYYRTPKFFTTFPTKEGDWVDIVDSSKRNAAAWCSSNAEFKEYSIQLDCLHLKRIRAVILHIAGTDFVFL